MLWVLTRGTLRPWEHWANSKAKQKCEKESVAKKATIPGHHLYLDLSKVTVKSSTPESMTINHDNWNILVCKLLGRSGVVLLRQKVMWGKGHASM